MLSGVRRRTSSILRQSRIRDGVPSEASLSTPRNAQFETRVSKYVVLRMMFIFRVSIQKGIEGCLDLTQDLIKLGVESIAPQLVVI